MLPKLYDPLLTLLFPQPCHVCQNSVENLSDGVACRDCWESTRLFSGDETCCAKCSAFLRDRPAPEPTFCHACEAHAYDAARAVGLYEAALAASVLALKREPHVSAGLKRLFLEAFAAAPFAGTEVIVPVPLAKKRRLERGFNQAEVLAEILARETGLEIDSLSLARTRHTPMHRAAMDRRARELTVEKAFEVRRAGLVKDRTVLLVDDVLTSGATVSACAEILKRQGARRVFVITLARAL